MWGKYGQTGTLWYCQRECKMAVTVGNSSVIFQKLKTEFPYDPAVLFLGIFPKDAEAETNRQRAHQCSQKRYSQQLTSGNRPSVH